jgi:hypothetical protein
MFVSLTFYFILSLSLLTVFLFSPFLHAKVGDLRFQQAMRRLEDEDSVEGDTDPKLVPLD